MGSLMAGWNSPVLDPKSVKYKRNRSLTKEEIDAFWKSKRKLEEEHLKAVSMPTDRFAAHDVVGRDSIRRSSSFPPAKEGYAESAVERKSLEKINKIGWMTRSNSASLNEPPAKIPVKEGERKSLEKLNKIGWWTRSNSAFLNEPPVLDGAARAYVSQYGVANVVSSKLNHSDGVGA